MKRKFLGRFISVSAELRKFFDRFLDFAKSKGCDEDFTFAFYCVVSGAFVALRTVCKLSDSDANYLVDWLFSEFKDYVGGEEIE